MTLAIGARLGPFEITGSLGAGGMGEVYRARDARLGRDVAIKVLPMSFSTDADRLQRFEQEARAAAALNHPNILAVHDIGTQDGAPYIVSELLEGETLRDRLSGGGLPVRKATEYAVQIARGLAAAHEKGIVHRDLKPDNVFITSDGRVKILDFGLAKLTEVEAAAASASLLPTTAPHTLPGVVLGTIGYMAPEQVRGLATDHRSDIFALGTVLYEMLSGQRAFAGDTAMDAMTAILKEDPPDLPADQHIPPGLSRIVDRCLEKSPSMRFKSADDLAFALDALSSQSGTADAAVGTVAPHGRDRLGWIVAGLLAIVIAVLVALPFVRTPPAAPETRLDITTPSTSEPSSFAISPDGRRLAYVATVDSVPRLWLRSLDSTTAQLLPGTDGASFPFWAPDGRSLGFFALGKLKRLDLGGTQPQELADSAGRGGAWNADGVILFARGGTGTLFRVPASGGESVAVTKLTTGQGSHRFPQFLPDGRRFLYYSQGSVESRGIYLGSLDSTESKRLTAAEAAGVFASPDWLLFVRQGALVARHVDLDRGELSGDAVAVAESILFDTNVNSAAVSIATSGVITYRTGSGNRRQLTWFSRTGQMLGTFSEADDSGLAAPKVSPDGRRVVVYRSVQGNNDIWILDGVHSTRLTSDLGQDRYGIWSSDGSRIFFDSTRKGLRQIYWKPSNNIGTEQLLLETNEDKVVLDRSNDGRFLLFQGYESTLAWNTWVLPLVGNDKPFAFLNSRADERNSRFSPDGRWVVYSSNESGRYEIYVRPFPKNDVQFPISTGGGIWCQWRPDGKEVYYIASDGKLMGVPIAIKGSVVEAGSPVALFQTRILGGGTNIDLGQQYDVAPDGRLLMNVVVEEVAATPITVVLNWAARRQ
jgi:serine/threonine protein kinase